MLAFKTKESFPNEKILIKWLMQAY